ncbi:MAG TPA: PAS domain S-box protein [Gaiellaceae bacterium]|nr:PAS domain S-box protein [Gaiellaceae bacterium]
MGDPGLPDGELRAAELRVLAAIVESSHAAVIGKTLDGVITSWNGGAERIYGYPVAEAVGRPIEMLVPDAIRGETEGLLARVRVGERIAAYETWRVRKDGTQVLMALTISPIRDEQGVIIGASTIAHDISERVRVEEALRLSEESYRNLFDHHPAPMWLYDPDSLRFLAVNEAATKQYGYTSDELLEMTIDQIRPREDVEALRGALAEPNRGYSPSTFWRHRKKDGTLIDVAITSSAIEYDGRPVRIVLAQDVTEQRRLEAQLRQAQKMEAIGELTGGIAHDFNNLLLVIRGHSALLLGRLEDDELRESAELIDAAAARAADFTRQLLAFSRQQVLQLEATDLNSVVEGTVKLLERTIGADIAVGLDLDPSLQAILADRSQLTQAVLNLAINARDAMAGRGGTLTIKTANAELGEAYVANHEGVAAGMYALLQITDSGTGMDEETQRRAFDPFFTTKETGTGLGLSAVHGLVKQSGGHIWLYSEPGMGTTFKLYFPITDAPVLGPAERAHVESLHGSETILLVEDTELVRTLVAATLEAFGYTVLSSGDGAEAIRLSEQANGPVDLLMTDVIMPGMNGRELAETLELSRPEMKVLFTSGYPSDTVVRHGIAEARAAFIEKPYLPEELARKVREVLDQ